MLPRVELSLMGLTFRDINNFLDILIKANDQQLDVLISQINKEKVRRQNGKKSIICQH